MSLYDGLWGDAHDSEDAMPGTRLLSSHRGLDLIQRDDGGFEVAFSEYSNFDAPTDSFEPSFHPVRTLAEFDLDELATHMEGVSGDHGFHLSLDDFFAERLSDLDAHSIYINKKDIVAMKKWLADAQNWALRHPAEEQGDKAYDLSSELKDAHSVSRSMSDDSHDYSDRGDDGPGDER